MLNKGVEKMNKPETDRDRTVRTTLSADRVPHPNRKITKKCKIRLER